MYQRRAPSSRTSNYIKNCMFILYICISCPYRKFICRFPLVWPVGAINLVNTELWVIDSIDVGLLFNDKARVVLILVGGSAL